MHLSLAPQGLLVPIQNLPSLPSAAVLVAHNSLGIEHCGGSCVASVRSVKLSACQFESCKCESINSAQHKCKRRRLQEFKRQNSESNLWALVWSLQRSCTIQPIFASDGSVFALHRSLSWGVPRSHEHRSLVRNVVRPFEASFLKMALPRRDHCP